MKRIQMTAVAFLLILSFFVQPLMIVQYTYADEVAATTEEVVSDVVSTEVSNVESGEQTAGSSAAASSESATESTSVTTEEEQQSSSAEESGSSVIDTSESESSSSEEHDDLSIHATNSSSIPTSSSTIIEVVSDIASTSQSGFVGLFEDVIDDAASSTQSEIDDATSTVPEIPDTGAPARGEASVGGSCSATNGESDNSTDETSADTNPTIRTGTSVVLANILNLLNTTFINSTGGILFSNFIDTAPTIDLRDLSLLNGMCGDAACSGQEGMQLNLVEDATIDNDLILDSMSGRNLASGVEGQNGTTTIETGDAIAGLNLVNIANTTFLNSQYLIVTLNAFRGVNGDIVFPSLLNFFAQGTPGLTLADGSTITNAATVANDVTAAAESGNNTTPGDTSIITAGNSNAHANVFNQINTLFPDSQISILFRISGTWNGNVFGVPDGVSQVRGPDGSLFIFGGPNQSGQGGPSTLLNSTSTADINNRVQVAALSGENAIENASSSVIATGEALASANIVNIANQNIIGRNWILAVIDIFGDFTGDIAFGRPDLWIGDQVEAPGVIQNGSELMYKITVINNGDAKATHVVVTEMPDFAHLDIIDASLSYGTSTPNALTWDLGTLPPGDAVEITYKARIKNSSQGQTITNTSTVGICETDNNAEDNTDSTTVRTTVISVGTGGSWYSPATLNSSNASGSSATTSADKLSVERITATSTVDWPNRTVEQKIIVKNGGNTPIIKATFHDMLRDSGGRPVHEEIWDLDSIAAHEEITIIYKVVFGDDAPAGIYTLSSTIIGKGFPQGYIAANGSILLKAGPQLLIASTGEIPKVRIIGRGAVQDGPILVQATTTLPGIPQTAGAASADWGVSERFIYLMLFFLLFAASYGALRLLSGDAREDQRLRF